MSTQTWIITGASQGFGRALAEVALDAGDRVVLGVRRPTTVADLATASPERVEVVEIDERDSTSIARLVPAAVDRFGGVDVVVNNAGRGVIGAAEEVTETELREVMDLHFFGPVTLVKAALPVLRAQGSGTIVQMSSQGGRIAFPGISPYAATKFALEGWSEALAGEVAAFGIRVMIVEPSRFRTGFNAEGALHFAQESPVYADALGPVRDDLTGADGKQEGDPVRAAEIIAELAHGEDVPLRLPLGREAVDRLARSYRTNLDEVSRLESLAVSADFTDSATPARPF